MVSNRCLHVERVRSTLYKIGSVGSLPIGYFVKWIRLNSALSFFRGWSSFSLQVAVACQQGKDLAFSKGWEAFRLVNSLRRRFVPSDEGLSCPSPFFLVCSSPLFSTDHVRPYVIVSPLLDLALGSWIAGFWSLRKEFKHQLTVLKSSQAPAEQYVCQLRII